MTDSTWMLRAIEEAAMQRALQRVHADPGLRVRGLTVRQVELLAEFYQQQTGRSAASIGMEK